MAMKPIACATIPLLLAALPTQAVTLEQLNKQVQQLNQRMAEQDSKFRINGFATFAIAKSDEAVAYNGVSDETNWNEFTRAGVQMSFQVNKSSSVVTQIVARGSEDFNANMEWAYFKHEFSHSLSAKIGRIRGPYYMLSEYLDVGYAVPWAQMPGETYSLLSSFANIDGADLTWSTDIGWNTLEVKGFYGQTSDENFIFKDIIGVSATYTTDTWSIRLASATAGLTFGSGEQGATTSSAQQLLEGSTSVGTQDGMFTSLGFRYDPGDILVLAEYTTATVDSITEDQDSMFVTLGYRIGHWMPHVTYGMHESTDNSDRDLPAGVPASTVVNVDGDTAGEVQALVRANSESDSTRIGLGVRYDWAAGTALKIQYDIVEANSAGLFEPSGYLASTPDSTNILTISIDTVF